MFDQTTASEVLGDYKGSGTKLDLPVRWVTSAKDELSLWANDVGRGNTRLSPSGIFGFAPPLMEPGSAKTRAPLDAFVVSQEPRPHVVVDSAVSVQAWEGEVLEVYEESFSVKLIDKTDRGAQDAFTEIDLSEIDQDDLDLVRPGAIFYWYVSYEHRASGKKRSSMMRFRRMPAWTADDLKRTEAYADDLFSSLTFEHLPSASA